MGWAIDAGTSMEAIGLACALYCVFASGLVAYCLPQRLKGF